MTKIVYSACFGGFGLSDEAMQRYADIKGLKVYPEKCNGWETFGKTFWLVPSNERDDSVSGQVLYDSDIDRTDPALVQVVEELGEKASTRYSNLLIRDVPAGEKYRIDEYDGFESIRTMDDYRWEIA